MKKLILFISIVIYSASAYSQEVTREDYGNYILETDSYHINRFAEERYFLVQRILHLGNRKYRVAYWNPNTGQRINGDYDGNQHYVVDFEQYVKDEKARRIKRKEQRRIAAENERKRQIELKKKEEEDRIRKEEERVAEAKEKIIKARSKVLNNYTKASKGKTNIWAGITRLNWLSQFLFKDKVYVLEKSFKENFNLTISNYESFVNKDFVVENEVEDIGIIELKTKDDFTILKAKIGVKNFFDDENIQYFINDKPIKYDLKLRELENTSLNNNFFNSNSKSNLLKEEPFLGSLNFPFYLKPLRDFESLNDFCSKYPFYKYLRKNRFKGNDRISKIINYFISNNIDYWNEYREDLIINVTEKGKWVIVRIENLTDNGSYNYFRINTKKWVVQKTQSNKPYFYEGFITLFEANGYDYYEILNKE